MHICERVQKGELLISIWEAERGSRGHASTRAGRGLMELVCEMEANGETRARKRIASPRPWSRKRASRARGRLRRWLRRACTALAPVLSGCKSGLLVIRDVLRCENDVTYVISSAPPSQNITVYVFRLVQ